MLTTRIPCLALAFLIARFLAPIAPAAPPTFSQGIADRAPAPAFATALGPVVADFDGDGHLDLATADFGSNSIFISFGKADGSAKSTTNFTGPTSPFFMLSADLDGDNKPDLIFATATGVKYFLNDGATPFSASVDLASPDVSVVSVGAADFNGDGFADIVASGDGSDGSGNTIGKIEIFLSTEDAGNHFTGYAAPIVFNAGPSAGRVAVGDLNGDGYPDVAIANTGFGAAEGAVTIYFGDPNALVNSTPFLVNPAQVSLAGHHPVGIAIGDITQDGNRDIVTSSYALLPDGNATLGLSFVDLLRNLGDDATKPTFMAGENFYFDNFSGPANSLDGPGSDVKLADFDGDGHADVAVVDSFDVRLHVLRLSPALDENSAYKNLVQDEDDTFPVNLSPHLLATADLNGDGDADVVIAHASSGGLTTLLNTTDITAAGPAKAIQFDVAAYTAYEGITGEADILVKRAADSTGSVTVKFTVGGTATPNGHPHSDFNLDDPQPDHAPLDSKHNTATLTFGPTEFEKHIFLAISSDPGSEPNETVVLTLQQPVGDAVLGKVKAATLTIIDSEPPALHPANALAAVPSSTITLTAQEKKDGVKAGGRTPAAWTFTTTQTLDKAAPNLGLKVQFSFVPPPHENWLDLPDGMMARPGGKGTKWVATSTKLPVCSKLYFRTVSTADNYLRGNGVTSAPYRVVASPLIQLTIKAEPDSDMNFNTQTHADETIVYRISYTNVSTVPAANVVVAAQIPANTRSFNGSGSTGIQLFGSGSDATGVYWNIGTVAPGGTGQVFFLVQVDTHLLDKMPKVPPLVGFADSRVPKFKALTDFSKKAKAKAAVYGALWSDPFSTSLLVAGGLNVTTPVVPALGVTVVADKNVAGTGDTITYTVTINNYAGYDFHEAKFTDRVPYGTALESVNTNDGSGNFTDVAITHPTPGTNPSVPVFQFGSQQLITWTLGTIPAKATRTLKFTVRTLFDLQTSFTDAAGVSHTAEVADHDFNVIATPPTGGTITTFSKNNPTKPVRTLISAADPAALPQIGFVKEARGEGKGVGELPQPGVGEVETVLPGDEVKYTLHYFNTGGSVARGCVIQEEVADGATFVGFLQINGTDFNLNQFVLRDKKGTVLPYPNHTIEQDLTLTRLLEFRVGDLAAGAQGTLSYKVAPTVKAGHLVVSNGYRIWSESLTQTVPGTPTQVVAKVVLPISFDTSVDRNKLDPVSAGDLLTYTVTFRNNGGFTASNVVVTSKIPDGTTYQSSSFPDPHVTGNVEVPTKANGNTIKFTVSSLHGSEESTTPDPLHPDTGTAAFVVRVNNPLLPALALPGATFLVKAETNGAYPSGALVRSARLRSLLTRLEPGGPLKLALASDDSILTRVNNGPTGPNLWGFKQYPQFVTKGQKLVYKIVFGNSGTVAIPGIRVGIQIPFGTTLDTQNTSPGYSLAKGILTWNRGTLSPHSADGVALVVNVKLDAAYAHDALEENSCYIASDAVTARNLTNSLSVVPGPSRTTVLSTAPVVAAWQAFGAWLQSIGSNIFGKGNSGIEAGVQQFSDGSINTTSRGADLIALTNGVLIIQNGGGNVIAAGAGNLVATGGGNLVATGGGNLVATGGGNLVATGGGNLIAAGGGNVIAAGAGNLISVQGVGFCTQVNLLNTINAIIAAGAGNIIAAGAGNLIRIDNGVGTLIGLDGNSLLDNGGHALRIDPQGPGVIAAGAGNLVATGGGNVIAAGAGNFTGGAATLLSSKPGFVGIVNPNGAGIVTGGANTLIGEGGSTLITNDGGTLITNDGATLITNDGATLIGEKGGGLVPKP